jgi:adenylosuccinate lyase
MPHKRTPILAERLTGLARLLRGYALAGMEDQALWHERDISHSSVERVALPGATTLLHYMLERFRGLVDGLVVRPERMAENLAAGNGLHASSRVLGALVEAGLPRPEAYRIVQRLALQASDARTSFRALVEADPEVTAALSSQVLEGCFDDRAALRHVAAVMARLDTLDGRPGEGGRP